MLYSLQPHSHKGNEMSKKQALALLLDVVVNMDPDQIVLVGGFDYDEVADARIMIAEHLANCDEMLRVS
jgi:hypothetical protein